MVATVQARIFAALVASFCVLGLCLAFVQPIYSLPDELAHWISANVRLEQLLGREGCVPTVQGAGCPPKRVCSPIPDLELTCTADMGLYGDVLTYPGALLAKLVLPRQTESAVRQVQAIILSRLLQGLLVVLCLVRVGVLARKTGRLGSLTLGAFMLSPLLAQQSFGISSDGAQLGFGLLLFACVMYWDALTYLDGLAFLLLGYAAAAKPTVLPLVLPALLVGCWFAQLGRAETSPLREVLRGLGRSLKFKLDRPPSPQTFLAWSGLALSAATVVLSLAHDSDSLVAAESADNARRAAHLQQLRERPSMIFELAAQFELAGQLPFRPHGVQMWVGPLGWLDTPLSRAVTNSFRNTFWIIFASELLALAALTARRRGVLVGAARRSLRALLPLLIGLLAVAGNVLFITAVMYVLWTPVDADSVTGIQARYFFPAAMVVIALVFRTFEAVLPNAGERELEFPPRTRWLAVAAPCLVLSLSLPYVARVYVDLALRYHNPAKYVYPRFVPVSVPDS